MAAKALHVLRVNARELLRSPGSVKEIGAAIPAIELGIDDGRIVGDISVDLHVVSTLDGVVVSGDVAIPWATSCRRCLTNVAGVRSVDVDELYQDEVLDKDAYTIESDQIDLAPAVREYVLIEVPDGPLCRDDCAGICAACGADRNKESCECDTTVRDERWAALDGLTFDEPDEP